MTNHRQRYYAIVIMNAPTILSHHTINEIATKSVEGLSQKVIANDLDIHQTTVSKYSNKPEVKELTQRLRETLQQRHTAKFIKRVVKNEKHISRLSDYALGLTNDNPTRYKDIQDIEKAIARTDKTGLAILKGVGILDTNTIRFGDDNSVNVTVSPAFQQFIDFRTNDNNGEEQLKTVDIKVSDGDK